jgi:hypothetical protein
MDCGRSYFITLAKVDPRPVQQSSFLYHLAALIYRAPISTDTAPDLRPATGTASLFLFHLAAFIYVYPSTDVARKDIHPDVVASLWYT